VWKKYGKALVSLAFFVWTVVAPLISGDNHIDRNEAIIIALGVGNGLLVYVIPLNPRWAAGKTVINAVLASLAAAQTLIIDGLQPDDWTIIIGAGLAILLGWYAPAISLPTTGEAVRVGPGFTA
jgi:hypothetical protein